MTRARVILESKVASTQGIFVLGCFEQRVTVYSQQVRALNLVDAILADSNHLGSRGKVAIVGGGVGGMTAAVALANAAPELEALDLFEERDNLVVRQSGSHRYLHPHFYDWPKLGSDEKDAGLPIMNWQAGTAGSVADTLIAEFEATRKTKALNVHTGRRVKSVNSNDKGLITVEIEGWHPNTRFYEAVILAIGFGVERFVGPENESYWSPSVLAAPIQTNPGNRPIFISGNGDGGLVDFLIAAFNGLDHTRICKFLQDLRLPDALAELERIEEEAWAVGADVDLLAEYRERLKELIPRGAWLAVTDLLRPNTPIHLHTKEPRLFKRETALHNRFLVYLVLEADSSRSANGGLIKLDVGVDFAGAAPESGMVTLMGGQGFIPYKRMLRLGPNADTNLSPFETLLKGHASAIKAARPSGRPSSPFLTTEAMRRFAASTVPPPPIGASNSAPQTPQTASNSVIVHIRLDDGGRIVWSGNMLPAHIVPALASGQQVELHCEIKAVKASRLMPAIARMAAQQDGLSLFVQDRNSWQTSLDQLCAADKQPGPGLNISFAVHDWADRPPSTESIELPIDEIIDTMHGQLDAITLEALDAALRGILGSQPVATGWPIELVLRANLLDLWRDWHALLNGDPERKRRFLRLLVNIEDMQVSDEAALIRVGPRIVTRFLAKPTIFALAFALVTEAPESVAPAVRHPGNVHLPALNGHACGVEWNGHMLIHGKMMSEHGWASTVVLLSELRETVQMITGDVRMDQVESSTLRLGTGSSAEKTVVIGANWEFLEALGTGAQAVTEFFRDHFQHLVATSVQSLDGG